MLLVKGGILLTCTLKVIDRSIKLAQHAVAFRDVRHGLLGLRQYGLCVGAFALICQQSRKRGVGRWILWLQLHCLTILLFRILKMFLLLIKTSERKACGSGLGIHGNRFEK